jgi:hypothetical protein
MGKNVHWKKEEVVYLNSVITKRHISEVNEIVRKINKTFMKTVKKNIKRGYTFCKVFRSTSKLQSHVVNDNIRTIIRGIRTPKEWTIDFYKKRNVRLFGFGYRYDIYISWKVVD